MCHKATRPTQELTLELEGLLPSAGLLNMKQLSNLIPSIDKLTGSQKLGLEFIEKWRAQFQAEHPDGVTEDWLQFNDHSLDQLPPSCWTKSKVHEQLR
ncbi:hypothetical protein [Pseudomonas juntendi]|uniref:hypothetical protein n=2 Tax=Pseudomonas TaxID=286 RepID=UPI003BA3730A